MADQDGEAQSRRCDRRRPDRSSGGKPDRGGSHTAAASHPVAAGHRAAAGLRAGKSIERGRLSSGGRPSQRRQTSRAWRQHRSSGHHSERPKRRPRGSSYKKPYSSSGQSSSGRGGIDRAALTTARGAMIVLGAINRPPRGGNRPCEDRPPRRDVPRTDAPSGGRPSGDRPPGDRPSGDRQWRRTALVATTVRPDAAAAGRPAVQRRCRGSTAVSTAPDRPRPDSRGGPRPDSRRDWQPRDNRQTRPYAPTRPAQLDSVDTRRRLSGEGEELIAGRRPVEEAFAARREAVRLLIVPERRAALDALAIHATTLRIPVVELEGGSLTALAGFDGHQGVALVAKPRPQADLESILAAPASATRRRSCWCSIRSRIRRTSARCCAVPRQCGVHGVIYPTRRAAPAQSIGHQGVSRRDRAPAPRRGRRPGRDARRSARRRPARRRRPRRTRSRYTDADLRGPLAIDRGQRGPRHVGPVQRRLDLARAHPDARQDRVAQRRRRRLDPALRCAQQRPGP